MGLSHWTATLLLMEHLAFGIALVCIGLVGPGWGVLLYLTHMKAVPWLERRLWRRAGGRGESPS